MTQTVLILRGSLKVGKDVQIDINVIIEGDCEIGDNVKIGAGCIIKNSKIASGTVVQPYSLFDNAVVGEDNQIGPFARLRPNAVTDKEVHIGNFVELKTPKWQAVQKPIIWRIWATLPLDKEPISAQAPSLPIMMVSISLKTEIGDEVRIGSNAVLIAPVTIGDRATIGARTCHQKPALPKNCPSPVYGKQVTIEGWQRPEKNLDIWIFA